MIFRLLAQEVPAKTWGNIINFKKVLFAQSSFFDLKNTTNAKKLPLFMQRTIIANDLHPWF